MSGFCSLVTSPVKAVWDFSTSSRLEKLEFEAKQEEKKTLKLNDRWDQIQEQLSGTQQNLTQSKTKIQLINKNVKELRNRIKELKKDWVIPESKYETLDDTLAKLTDDRLAFVKSNRTLIRIHNTLIKINHLRERFVEESRTWKHALVEIDDIQRSFYDKLTNIPKDHRSKSLQHQLNRVTHDYVKLSSENYKAKVYDNKLKDLSRKVLSWSIDTFAQEEYEQVQRAIEETSLFFAHLTQLANESLNERNQHTANITKAYSDSQRSFSWYRPTDYLSKGFTLAQTVLSIYGLFVGGQKVFNSIAGSTPKPTLTTPNNHSDPINSNPLNSRPSFPSKNNPRDPVIDPSVFATTVGSGGWGFVEHLLPDPNVMHNIIEEIEQEQHKLDPPLPRSSDQQDSAHENSRDLARDYWRKQSNQNAKD